jgi:hypothetical protein
MEGDPSHMPVAQTRCPELQAPLGLGDGQRLAGVDCHGHCLLKVEFCCLGAQRSSGFAHDLRPVPFEQQR